MRISASGVAHDLTNPLTATLSVAGLTQCKLVFPLIDPLDQGANVAVRDGLRYELHIYTLMLEADLVEDSLILITSES